MKRKIVLLTGLLAVSAALILVSAPKAKACEGGDGGTQKFVLTGCYDRNGNFSHYSNNCEAGSRTCSDNVC
jgi:hypothetical protein